MIKFLLFVNDNGSARVSKYYTQDGVEDRKTKESEVIRICLSRNNSQSAFFDYEDYTLVYRRYTGIVLLAGITREENELAVYELFHLILETLHLYLNGVSELSILSNLDRVHMLIDEVIVNGCIAETNFERIRAPVQLLTPTKR